jgi:hypothetical protein
LATSGAGLFTNPLEVIKTRMQLQGELKVFENHRYNTTMIVPKSLLL